MSRLFGDAVHVAYVVPDVDREMQRMLAMGVGPFYVMRHIRPSARYRGQRHDPLITAAFVYSGGMQFEFLQMHDDTPSAYREFLERNPQGGMQHVAYFSDSFDEALKSAERAGRRYEVVQEFIDPAGVAYEIYLAPEGEENPLLVQLVAHGRISEMFDRIREACDTWDGSDPIRDATAIRRREAPVASH